MSKLVTLRNILRFFEESSRLSSMHNTEIASAKKFWGIGLFSTPHVHMPGKGHIRRQVLEGTNGITKESAVKRKTDLRLCSRENN